MTRRLHNDSRRAVLTLVVGLAAAYGCNTDGTPLDPGGTTGQTAAGWIEGEIPESRGSYRGSVVDRSDEDPFGDDEDDDFDDEDFDEEEHDDDDDGDDDFDGTEALFWGEGQVDASGAFAGELSFLVLSYEGEDERVLCAAHWQLTGRLLDASCDGCVLVLTLEPSDGRVEVDDDASCADYAMGPTMAPSAIALSLRDGIDDAWFTRRGDGWDEAGWAEIEDGGRSIGFEWFVEPGALDP